jgi:hypothetical protein
MDAILQMDGSALVVILGGLGLVALAVLILRLGKRLG